MNSFGVAIFQTLAVNEMSRVIHGLSKTVFIVTFFNLPREHLVFEKKMKKKKGFFKSNH